MKKLTQERVKELLNYNQKTGDFTWKERCVGDFNHCKNFEHLRRVWNGRHAGNTTGCKNRKGYLEISVEGKTYLAHRLVWLYIHGYFPENTIDHIDRNPSNNKLSNLREVSHTCNMRNCKVRSNNKSGITGVCWHKARFKWHAQIKVNGKVTHLGYFEDIVDAAKASYDLWGYDWQRYR